MYRTPKVGDDIIIPIGSSFSSHWIGEIKITDERSIIMVKPYNSNSLNIGFKGSIFNFDIFDEKTYGKNWKFKKDYIKRKSISWL
jgi:hypothetical protein